MKVSSNRGYATVATGGVALFLLACDRPAARDLGASADAGARASVTEITGAAARSETERQGAAPGSQAAPAAAASVATPTPTPQPFDGEVQVRVPGKASESLSYAVKGDKVRLGLVPANKGKGVDAIIDVGDRRVTVLLNDRKEFVEVDVDKLAASAKERLADVSVERTGRSDIVYGRSCEEWILRDKEFQVTTCVARGAPLFDLGAVEQTIGFEAPQWLERVVSEGYVPLRVTLRDSQGQPVAKTEVVDVGGKVDASTFEVPEGYRKANPSRLPVPKR